MRKEDTVNVRLTEHGLEMAQGGTLRLHGGKVPLSFTGDKPSTVHLTAWHELLKTTAPHGKPLFEIVPAAEQPATQPASEE
jgi:hypothetical protein